MNRFLSLMLLISSCMSLWGISRGLREIEVGDSIPYFSVRTDSNIIEKKSLLGKPSVIVFFHTRCYDCRRELPELQKIYEMYRNQVNFLCISRGDSIVNVADYWLKNALTIPVSAQSDNRVFRLFAENRIPRIYVCDVDGIVVKVFKERVRHRKLTGLLDKILY